MTHVQINFPDGDTSFVPMASLILLQHQGMYYVSVYPEKVDKITHEEYHRLAVILAGGVK